MVAEDEKTRRLNKKTCVAHALRLIGCVPWIIPGRHCQLGKHAEAAFAHTHTHTHTHTHRVGNKRNPLIQTTPWHTHHSSVCSVWSQIYACGLDTLVSNQTSQFCFGHHYTYTAAPITLPESAHIWAPVLKHAFTQKAKACIICQAKWQSYALFITLTHQVCTTDAKIETDATVIENAT